MQSLQSEERYPEGKVRNGLVKTFDSELKEWIYLSKNVISITAPDAQINNYLEVILRNAGYLT